MAELPDEVKEEIDRLCAEGDELLDEEQYNEALTRYRSAWELLPEPRDDWDASEWILAAMGDVYYFSGHFDDGLNAFMRIIKSGGSPDNPYYRLRLGQCLYELGNMTEAANWLTGAFLLEGNKVFADDDPKYLEFVKSQLEPPPSGWPEGW